jgi:hypothetical protein
MAGLVLSDNILYETAAGGGSSGNGTVFGVSFAPQLAINHSEANVVLTWPNNVAGFDYTGDTLLCNTRPRRCKLQTRGVENEQVTAKRSKGFPAFDIRTDPL